MRLHYSDVKEANVSRAYQVLYSQTFIQSVTLFVIVDIPAVWIFAADFLFDLYISFLWPL